MTPYEVLETIFAKLERLGIPYMVVGSFASSAYGLVRSTNDADLIVDLQPDKARGLVEATANEFYVDLGQVERAVASKQFFNIIHLGTFFKVDFFRFPPPRLGARNSRGVSLTLWACQLEAKSGWQRPRMSCFPSCDRTERAAKSQSFNGGT